MASSQPNKRLIKSHSGLKLTSLAGCRGKSPFEIAEPNWVPDKSTSSCMKCDCKFDFLKRRHHCRRCGHCFCGSCCKTKLRLPRMCFVDPVLMCTDCGVITKKENEFFDKYIKILLGGAAFFLENQAMSTADVGATSLAASPEQVICKLSQDHKCLLIESSSERAASIEPVELESLKGVKTMGEPQTPGSAAQASGMVLHYRDSHGELQTLRLAAVPEPKESRKNSQLWVISMHKAAKLLFPDAQSPLNTTA